MDRLTVKLFQATGLINVGQLAYRKGLAYLQLDKAFLDTSLHLSPYQIKLNSALQKAERDPFNGLHGVFSDSLPDGWGQLLMDRYFRAKGVDTTVMTPLLRLAYVGSRGMGALTYEPECSDEAGTDDLLISLSALADEAEQIFQGNDADVTQALYITGSSPGGARPKALIGLKGNKAISGVHDLPEGYEYWLVKFPTGKTKTDRLEGVTEYIYSVLANNSGIDFPETRLIDVNDDRFFACQRFDRTDDGNRIHMHTMAGLLNANFRVPDSDYETLMRLTSGLTKSYEDSCQVMLRLLFNVITGNRDDHIKNFSFLMDFAGSWRLSPAYDITFSEGINNEHTMSISGHGSDVPIAALFNIGRLAGLKEKKITEMIEQVADQVVNWRQLALENDISHEVINEIERYIDTQLMRLRPNNRMMPKR